MMSVVTNIDSDHLSTYGGDCRRRCATASSSFLHNLPFYGVAVMCSDDPGVRAILPQAASAPVLTYGVSEDADIRVDRHRQTDGTREDVVSGCRGAGVTSEALDGRAQPAGASQRPERAGRDRRGAGTRTRRRRGRAIALRGRFQGIDRRMQITRPGARRERRRRDCSSTTTVITRPKLPRRCRRCAPAGPTGASCWCFQPHRYTRTQELLDDFAEVLSENSAAAGHRSVRGRRRRDSRRGRARDLPCRARSRAGRAGIRRRSRRIAEPPQRRFCATATWC